MKFFTLAVVIFFICAEKSFAREVTNADIRDAMLSLLKIVNNLESKLERHESRERALGEQLKRMLTPLEKVHRTLEPLKGAVSRLDERLAKVETILIQKDEKEKQQSDKANEAIEKLRVSLKSWSDNVTNTVRSEIKSIPKPVINNNASIAKLADLEKVLGKKIDSIAPHTEVVMKKSVETISQNQRKEVECKKSNLDENLLNKHFDHVQELLNRFDLKLVEQNLNISKVQSQILPLTDMVAADEAWHNKMANVIDKQNQDLIKIQKSIQDTERALKSIPTLTEIGNLNNLTIDALVKMQSEAIEKSGECIMKIKPDLQEIKKSCESTMSIKDIIQNITETCNTSEDINLNVMKGFEVLKSELQVLPKVERVMLQTADGVLDTKRRIEYGIHQISMDVAETVKLQSTALNKTLFKRFEDIEISIVESQTDALGNLSKKIEHEMSQVWRQVGIMYQQLTASNTVLDRLQAQTEQYVNGSLSAMDGMEGKVGLITKRMSDIESDLNYLLGRLSLVTQEFNQIKDGLGKALDSIKNRFKEVQTKIEGPGPHNIPDES